MSDTLTPKDYIIKRKIEIGRNIRSLRRSQGLTQEDIARYLDCSRKRVNRAEQGHIELAIGEMELLAKAFNAGICQLIGSSVGGQV